MIEFFSQQWATYRAIVDNNLMEHRQLTAAVAEAVQAWFAARPADAGPADLADLGCGDLALMAPLYRQWPLASLLAVDCTAEVLPLAQQQLGQVPYPCRWLEMDLLAWASSANQAGQATGQQNQQLDLILTSFAVHHLNDKEKGQFLEGCSRKLRPGGLLLWADVFRQPGEQRQEYVDRYSQRVRQGWLVLNASQQDQVINHLSSCDFPAAADAVMPLAEAAGFGCRWLWRGEHQAEALLALMPNGGSN